MNSAARASRSHGLRYGLPGFVLPALVLTLAACARESRAPWNVIVVTIDTLRADRLGCYGYEPVATPAMDRLAREGVRFARAFSEVPVTLPSHCTMFTGRSTFVHGVRNNGTYALGAEEVTLAERLQARGYETAAFVGGFPLAAQFGLDQGFDFYEDNLEQHVPAGEPDGQGNRLFLADVERPAEAVNRAVFDWLDRRGAERAARPVFLWVHYFDPHHPYAAPSPFGEKYRSRPYDGEIAYADQQLGRLVARLEEQGLLARSLVVLTSDHGESQLEHGEETHGFFIYDSTLRVPLIVRAPGALPAGVVREEPVSLVDLTPTVLEFLGLELEAEALQGRSLLALARGEAQATRPLYAESLLPQVEFGWGALRGWRRDRWQYIDAPTPELYDVQHDPAQEQDLATEHADTIAALRAELAAYRRLHGAERHSRRELDPEQRRRLQSLGYLGGAGDAAATEAQAARNPRDMFPLYRKCEQALDDTADGNYDEAIALLDEVVREEPSNRLIGKMLAESLVLAGRLERAEAELNRLLAEHPDFDVGYRLLARTLERQGRAGEALERLHRALPLVVDRATLQIELSRLHAREGDWERAIAALLAALEAKPDNAALYQGLGQLYEAQGDRERAVASYEKSLARVPNRADVLDRLGSLQLELGNRAGAIRSFERAQRADPGHARSLAKLLELAPGDPAAAAALERLATE